MKGTTRTANRVGVIGVPLVSLAVAIMLAGCSGGSHPVATPAAFCATVRQTRADPNRIFAGLGSAPDSYGPSTEAKVVLPAMERVDRVFHRLDQEAPPAIKPDVDTVMRSFDQVVVDLHHGRTVAQVDAYARSHPPPAEVIRNSSTAERNVGNYLSTVCHVNNP